MDRYGDFNVGRSIKAGRRVSGGAAAETLSARRDVTLHDFQWLRLSGASQQDVVLPDATTLYLGWDIVIDVPSTSTAGMIVKTFHGVTPVTLKSVIVGRAYKFTCVGIDDAAGLWQINFLEEADLIPTERFVSTFNNTSDWGTESLGYYTITVLATTHGRGIQPSVAVRALDSSDYITVSPDRVKILSNGNVQIRVPSVPDLRFAGQILFI